MDLRIGLGIDLHRLAPGRPCVLGGIVLRSNVGPVGHSDGDAVLHAVCDACLGAAGMTDLGSRFRDSDPAHRGQDSAEFCKLVLADLRAAHFRILSLDIVVEAEQPKLGPHRQAMRERIAALFDLSPDQVNIKGKTAEKLGPIGAGEALRATAVALLAKELL